jgi:orotate phosphoribosyltransferase
MNYRSVASLDRLVVNWLCRLPRDLDVIVGVPRSGMLVANLMALHMNLPMTDIEGLLNSRLIYFSGRCPQLDLRQRRKVLIVDDALSTGRQLEKLRQRLAEAALPHEILYGAAYVRTGAEQWIEFYGEHLDDPQLFEWNMMHHPVLLGSCLDIDGVLCEDPAEGIDDDGESYCRFLKHAKPMIIPTMPVGWLVTARLEKYRKLTERWLLKHAIEYRELVMMDAPDNAARLNGQSHGEYKAHVYERTGADLFIESCPMQSIEIADLSGRTVFCMSTGEMVAPAKRDRRQAMPPASRCLTRAAAGPNPLLAGGSSWTLQLQSAAVQLLQIVPPGESAIVMDDWHWAMGKTFAGRRLIRFVERDGHYSGPPSDDATAITEFERLRRELDVPYAVLGWPAFWWLESYPQFFQHLRRHYPCRVENNQMLVFELGAAMTKGASK